MWTALSLGAYRFGSAKTCRTGIGLLDKPKTQDDHWPTASIFSPMFHMDDISGEIGRNGTGLPDAFKLTKLVWTVTLVIIIER